MGNCLKSPTSDDISLLHESQSDRASYGDGADTEQEPPPPYEVGFPSCVRQNTNYRSVIVRLEAKLPELDLVSLDVAPMCF